MGTGNQHLCLLFCSAHLGFQILGSHYKTRSLQALETDERGLVKSPCTISLIPIFSTLAHFQTGTGMHLCMPQRRLELRYHWDSSGSPGLVALAQTSPASNFPSFQKGNKKLNREGNARTPTCSEGERVL